MTPCQKTMCATCIFREDGAALPLRPGRLAEIQAYLIQGQAHLCHSGPVAGRSADRICRGSRNYQLMIWHRLGILPEPTDEALAAEMRRVGHTIEIEKGDEPS